MYARSTTIAASAALIDDGIAYVRDKMMPTLKRIEGCTGMSLIVDRQSGQFITTSAWRSSEAVHRAENQLRPVRTCAEQMLGSVTALDDWEIAVLHRDHRSRPGAGVRATWIQVDPAIVERVIDVYRTATVPSVENLEGFASTSLLVDRKSGVLVSSAAYGTVASMQRNRGQARLVRTASANAVAAKVLHVGEYELALAHLRLPEMA